MGISTTSKDQQHQHRCRIFTYAGLSVRALLRRACSPSTAPVVVIVTPIAWGCCRVWVAYVEPGSVGGMNDGSGRFARSPGRLFIGSWTKASGGGAGRTTVARDSSEPSIATGCARFGASGASENIARSVDIATRNVVRTEKSTLSKNAAETSGKRTHTASPTPPERAPLSFTKTFQ